MTLRSMLTQTVTVHAYSEGATDRLGSPVESWATPGVDWPARLEHRSGLEQNGDRNTQIGEWFLILPPEAVITGRDRVTADGATFEVVGPPLLQRTPRGPHHIEATLRHIEGG